MNRFFNKTQKRKVIHSSPIILKTPHVETKKPLKEKTEEKKLEEQKENNDLINNKEMEDKRLEKIERIMSSKAPKRKVKVEKKDKGLIERTEGSTILLTEDNKMLLTD